MFELTWLSYTTDLCFVCCDLKIFALPHLSIPLDLRPRGSMSKTKNKSRNYRKEIEYHETRLSSEEQKFLQKLQKMLFGKILVFVCMSFQKQLTVSVMIFSVRLSVPQSVLAVYSSIL